MKFSAVIILILVLIGGTFLIYLAAFYFFLQTSTKEISFAPIETATKAAKEATKHQSPDFVTLNTDGEKIKLSDFRDKIVILTFWTTWNPATQDQITILNSYFQEIKNDPGVVLLTVNNLDDKSAVANFLRRGNYVLPGLLDEDVKIGEGGG